MADYQSTLSNNDITDAINKYNACNNKIIVSAPVGSIVTAKCGSTTLTSISDYNGQYSFDYDKFGEWIITIVNGQEVTTETVLVNELKDYYLNYYPSLNPVLNNNTWGQIKSAAVQGLGSTFWTIGSKKELVLDGTVSAYTPRGSQSHTFSNEHMYAFIIGFDHNAVVETDGECSIHFQLGQDVVSNRKIAFYFNNNTDNMLTMFSNTDSLDEQVNWPSSFIRTILGQDKSASNTFLSCLKDDENGGTTLRDSIRQVKKYSGYSETGDYVDTGSTNYIFILSSHEVSVGGWSDVNYDNIETYSYYNISDYDMSCAQRARYVYPYSNNHLSFAAYWLRDVSISPEYGKAMYIVSDSPVPGSEYASDLSPNSNFAWTPCFVVG